MKWKYAAAAAVAAPLVALGAAQVRSAVLAPRATSGAVFRDLDEPLKHRDEANLLALAQDKPGSPPPNATAPSEAAPGTPRDEGASDAARSRDAAVKEGEPPLPTDATATAPEPNLPSDPPQDPLLPNRLDDGRHDVLAPVDAPPVMPPTDLAPLSSGHVRRSPTAPSQDRPTDLESLPRQRLRRSAPSTVQDGPTDLEALPSGPVRRSSAPLDLLPELAPPGQLRSETVITAPQPVPTESLTASSPPQSQVTEIVRRLVQAEAGGTSPEATPFDETLSDLSNQLRAQLNDEFADRQRRYSSEVDALEARVKKLREMIQKREENRGEIIHRRIQQLKVEAQGMGW